ncbi:transposase, partial [Mesorhizobium sp. M2E.F.Ca.ET.154.01.1.1]
RNGLVIGATLTPATGTAEREAALALLDRLGAKRRITLGADKAYDAREFVAALRKRKVTPHIAKHEYVDKNGILRRSALDARTTRHPGYAVSLRIRKRIE